MDWTNGGKLAENLIALKSCVAKQNITLDVNFIFFESVVTEKESYRERKFTHPDPLIPAPSTEGVRRG